MVGVECYAARVAGANGDLNFLQLIDGRSRSYKLQCNQLQNY